MSIFIKKITPKNENLIDSDVKEEENKIERMNPKDAEVCVNKLKKIYFTGLKNATLAVDNSSFFIETG